MLFYSAD